MPYSRSPYAGDSHCAGDWRTNEMSKKHDGLQDIIDEALSSMAADCAGVGRTHEIISARGSMMANCLPAGNGDMSGAVSNWFVGGGTRRPLPPRGSARLRQGTSVSSLCAVAGAYRRPSSASSRTRSYLLRSAAVSLSPLTVSSKAVRSTTSSSLPKFSSVSQPIILRIVATLARLLA